MLLKSKLFRQFLSLILIGFITTGYLVSIAPSFAAPILSLKWSRYLGSNAGTYIGALAADINNDGKMEIIVTGAPANSTDGVVTALEGNTGNIIWQVSARGVTRHSPFDIVDLDSNGDLEIVISTASLSVGTIQGILVLHAKNGSVWWRNALAPTDSPWDGLTCAIADIDGDDYMEIFASGGRGPYQGYDYVTKLSYDGKILAQSPISWHPCYGGLTIADPAFNGTFIIYQGDRSSTYSSPTDPYKGGGWGVRAIDARTLTPLWNDPDILCSSHTPMLADVDKDGILDVVIAHQGGGFAVYNAFTGIVLTTGGVYRKNLTLTDPQGNRIRSHSQPTICDIDYDGNLEIITARNSKIYIWDLFEWKLDAILPTTVGEPPRVGDITGDGRMDIIAANGTGIYIYTYNSNSATYDLVDYVTPGANAFTLVADVDNDGLNELIVTTAGGWVRCYDTLGLTPNPPPRTNIQFYSEYHLGTAEYVPPPGPCAPIISEPTPPDGAANIPITLPQLTFKLTDFQQDPISYTVTTNPNIGSTSGTITQNGKITVPILGLAYSTTYTWTVTATDGTYTTTKTFTFTTSDLPPWYNIDWQRRKTIVINHTKVSGDQTDFPVLIDLVDSDLAKKAQPDGDDILFTDQDNNKLDHQIEYYDNASGRLIAWVRIPYLSSTTDTKIYMYYGNPNCENQQNPTAVWDTSYKLVLHLNELAGIHYDSTINANDGTPRNGVQQGVAAKIDGGDYFGGIDDYIEIPHSGTLAGYTEALTISFWVKFEDTSRRQTILGKYNRVTNQRGWFVDYNPVDRPTRPLGFYASWDGANYREWYAANFVPTAGVWYHITIVWEANAIPRFYINGVQVPTVGTATIPQIYNNVGVPLLIGRCQYDNSRYFKGYLDEITISNPARSANWILTTYNNQLNPTAFYSIGPEEPFEEAYVLTITVEGQGTVHIDPQKTAYKQGENVTLTAIPDEGYNFEGWSGDIISQESSINVTITKNMIITARFTLKQYVINATVSGIGGTIQPSGLITVYHGETITFTIMPDIGYHIEDVIVDDVSLGPIDNYTFYSVNANHTIIAFFAPNQYTPTIIIIGNGTVAKSPDKEVYNHGEIVTLTATADPRSEERRVGKECRSRWSPYH